MAESSRRWRKSSGRQRNREGDSRIDLMMAEIRWVTACV
uniref:Uncharacterized protein n=1 Tax=Arundo donax TaxID=35708 RepID=A0A0A8ZFU3_ARUDO